MSRLLEHKEFIVLMDDFSLRRSTGWSCGGNDGYYWFPDLGFSASTNIFIWEEEALEARDYLIEKEIERLEALYDAPIV
jgi:hypothetical protein